MSSVTFVTAFINLYNEIFDNKDTKWRYNNFIKLAKTGINICLYTDDYCYNDLSEIIINYPNVKMMRIFNLEQTFAFKSCETLDFSLPDNKHNKKDTVKYMYLQHSKIEFVNDAIHENPWKSTHFAWIDFSIFYIFKNVETVSNYLYILSRRPYLSKIMVFPGCWNSIKNRQPDNILNSVCWRFCGGFFLGDNDSIMQFFELYKRHFKNFITEKKKLVWEVNYWAWLEANTDWKPSWYLGDHNDTIFNIPTNFYALLLNDKLETTNYDFPRIENFFPSNTSFLSHKGKKILNVRFVNYSYAENGRYNIKHPNGTIITKNIVSQLNDEFIPISYNLMSEENIGLLHHDMYSFGLEDIRLYSFGDTIKYIATNVNYVGNKANRMIIGEYDIESHSYVNSRIIQPPENTSCEKNWIPIIKNGEECFIYKWSPFQIGKINYETNRLEIVDSHEIKSPDFHRIRGSSIFIDYGDNYRIGVVHFCEETWPRQYYHILVILDKNTLLPISYSDPFCFQHYGVEFCIGFTMTQDNYVFWVSKKDNDAVMVKIDSSEIPIHHKIKN